MAKQELLKGDLNAEAHLSNYSSNVRDSYKMHSAARAKLSFCWLERARGLGRILVCQDKATLLGFPSNNSPVVEVRMTILVAKLLTKGSSIDPGLFRIPTHDLSEHEHSVALNSQYRKRDEANLSSHLQCLGRMRLGTRCQPLSIFDLSCIH